MPKKPDEKNNAMKPPETMASLVWRRFRRHPGAMVGAVILTILIISILLAGLSPYDPEISDIKNRFQPPSWTHLFGTDGLGRDVLVRVLYGGRVSLTVGFLVVAITLSIGVPIGSAAGYFGGWVDNILSKLIDATLSLPALMFMILLAAILREITWPTVARLVRAIFLTFREMEYVTAAKALGASDFRIIISEILPNGFGPIIVESTLGIGYAIMEESTLSFLGFGIMPPTPSWGNLLDNAQEHLSEYPWLAIFPGLMIFLTIISINFIGDGLRDALDPYKILAQIDE